MKKILMLSVILFYTIALSLAQNTVASAGGDISNSEVKISFTLGQVFYHVYDAGNNSVAEGVQQPYEISVVTSISEDVIDIDLEVYPNPTSDFIRFVYNSNEKVDLEYSIFDFRGKLIEENSLNTNAEIDFSNFPPATYFVRVNSKNSNKQIIKNFKIIKN